MADRAIADLDQVTSINDSDSFVLQHGSQAMRLMGSSLSSYINGKIGSKADQTALDAEATARQAKDNELEKSIDGLEGTISNIDDEIDEIENGLSKKMPTPSVSGTSGQVLATDGIGGTYWKTVEGGGGGGTSTSYDDLDNKPTINGIQLVGNRETVVFAYANPTSFTEGNVKDIRINLKTGVMFVCIKSESGVYTWLDVTDEPIVVNEILRMKFNASESNETVSFTIIPDIVGETLCIN